MWTRKELKEQGKFAFKRNYWKCVIVALLVSLITVGHGGGVQWHSNRPDVHTLQTSDLNTDISITGYPDDTTITFDDGNLVLTGKTADELAESLQNAGITTEEDLESAANDLKNLAGPAIAAAIIGGILVFIITFVVIAAIALAINAFIINPFVVGATRFFVKNLDEEASVTNIGFGYDNQYKNIAWTMFYRDLYTLLWSLLFIIPGIVKAYEYRMIPYLLSENPGMSKDEAFAVSKEMMTGNKWKAFVLDLSFLGWHLLSLLTLGILEIFYVQPYKCSTDAALYRKLTLLRNGADPAVNESQEILTSNEL